jgi:hypothetical protein
MVLGVWDGNETHDQLVKQLSNDLSVPPRGVRCSPVLGRHNHGGADILVHKEQQRQSEAKPHRGEQARPGQEIHAGRLEVDIEQGRELFHCCRDGWAGWDCATGVSWVRQREGPCHPSWPCGQRSRQIGPTKQVALVVVNTLASAGPSLTVDVAENGRANEAH